MNNYQIIVRKAILQFDQKFRTSIEKSELEFDEFICYIWIGSVIRTALDKFKLGDNSEMLQLLKMAEYFHNHSDQEVREFSSVGIIEGIQNIAGCKDIEYGKFIQLIPPALLPAWKDVIKFWNGEIPVIPDRCNK